MNATPRHSPHGGNTAGETAAWIRVMDDVSRRLAAVRGPSEDIFLGMGLRLRDAQNTARDLVVLANSLNSRLAEPEFRAAIAGLDEAVAVVEALDSRKDGRRGVLTALDARAATIRASLTSLDRVLRRIKVVGMNARIEAAQMSDGAGFDVFTQQVLDLVTHGQTVVAGAQADIGRLSAAVAGALASQSVFDANQRRQLSAVAANLGTSVAQMRSREAQAQVVLGDLPVLLERTRAAIAAIVGDLQIGDMVRQRLEHVGEALEAGSNALADRPGATAPEHTGEHMDSLHNRVLCNAVCELQARQLDSIGADFRERIGSISTACGTLATTLEEARGRTESVYSGDTDSASGSTFLMSLDRELRSVGAVIAHYDAALRDTDSAVTAVQGLVVTMTASMLALDDVDAEINVIGLNASIKCGNLGSRGMALNVVAQELRGYARQTRTLAGAIAAQLAEVSAAASGLARSGDEEFEQRLDVLRGHLDGTVEYLEHGAGETAWVLARIQEKAAQVGRSLHTTQTELQGQMGAAATVSDAARQMAEFAASIDPGLAPHDLRRAREEVLTFMSSRYTMASERDLHDMLLGGSPPPKPPSKPAPKPFGAPSGEPDLSDFLF